MNSNVSRVGEFLEPEPQCFLQLFRGLGGRGGIEDAGGPVEENPSECPTLIARYRATRGGYRIRVVGR